MAAAFIVSYPFAMEQMGFDYRRAAEDYDRVERAVRFLEDRFKDQPPLAEIAAAAGMSEFHFQRLFGRWVGISPKRFLQFLTKEFAKRLLEESKSVLDVAFEAGLSGPGRLHDLFVHCEAVTPGEFKSRGEGLEIHYGFHAGPFGECLIARTKRGICGLVFVERGNRAGALDRLRSDWSQAALFEDAQGTQALVRAIFYPRWAQGEQPLHLFLRGTNFQLKVWEALLAIPAGQVTSYSRLAARIGSPRAVRAVGTAVGMNPIPFLIPCHRVIRGVGEIGGYRYGSARKKVLVAFEAAQSKASAP